MTHTVKPGETLSQIARDYRVPLQTIILANPGINPDIIYVGQRIIIPGIPDPASNPYQIDISVNSRTLKLLRNGMLQKQFPIAVGKMVSATPFGNFIIINKAPNPGGPFGTMWMSLSKQHYGIHGTNNPSSIGKAVSKGCIRMYNRDVEELARTIPIGTPVYIHP
ncbi:L,D-transpeptidase family protein [Rossellomorea aquimaris]|uniref:L,D-transpeptidase family protein n=1 Tax=Rossellomorea aquimaris TaxID=189382 RepID=UPI001CD806FD|nr:L,D-transpeptidase family protein [Rossellomorea aquimaris]MCA1054010.1 L,D-transpeptidase family protein [Rossellomorea aquimaris]